MYLNNLDIYNWICYQQITINISVFSWDIARHDNIRQSSQTNISI